MAASRAVWPRAVEQRCHEGDRENDGLNRGAQGSGSFTGSERAKDRLRLQFIDYFTTSCARFARGTRLGCGARLGLAGFGRLGGVDVEVAQFSNRGPGRGRALNGAAEGDAGGLASPHRWRVHAAWRNTGLGCQRALSSDQAELFRQGVGRLEAAKAASGFPVLVARSTECARHKQSSVAGSQHPFRANFGL